MTRLYFCDATDIHGTDGLGVILLIDGERQRGISIVCEHAMVEQLRLRRSKATDTSRQLPEALWTVIRRQQQDCRFIILFNNMRGEEYVVFLYNETLSQATPLRASDAVLLAMVSDLPIMMDDQLFRRQSVALSSGENGIRIPINSLSTEMLRQALQHAIDEEQFEHASHIRDELKRREQGNGNN